MSTVGIVALSILAAIFLFTLLAGVCLLVWLAWTQKKATAALLAYATSVHAETEKLLATHQAESKAILESSKASLGAIRGEIKSSLDLHQQAWKQTMEGHFKEFRQTTEAFKLDINAAIAKINAEALQTVAVRLTQTCQRAEKAIGVLQQLVLDQERSPHFDGGAEDFAPENNRFGAPPSGYSKSLTSQMDEEFDHMNQTDNQTEALAEV
jgi:hypothetical protein